MRAFTIALLLMTTGCTDELLKQRDPMAARGHSRITHDGSEFKVVLLKDGRVEIHTSDGNHWTLLEGAIELSNGKGTLFVRKVEQ